MELFPNVHDLAKIRRAAIRHFRNNNDLDISEAVQFEHEQKVLEQLNERGTSDNLVPALALLGYLTGIGTDNYLSIVEGIKAELSPAGKDFLVSLQTVASDASLLDVILDGFYTTEKPVYRSSKHILYH